MTSGPTTATASPWFVRPPSPEATARLFCFPFSGSGASAFSAWPAALDDVEVCPVQFPGRENRLAHPHYGTYDNLAAGLTEALSPCWRGRTRSSGTARAPCPPTRPCSGSPPSACPHPSASSCPASPRRTTPRATGCSP
ncbi:thioesterase II family protein [Streptomyces erythrogriseus]